MERGVGKVGVGVGEWGAIVSRVSFWEDEKVLEMDDGEGWTTAGMSLLQLNT